MPGTYPRPPTEPEPLNEGRRHLSTGCSAGHGRHGAARSPEEHAPGCADRDGAAAEIMTGRIPAAARGRRALGLAAQAPVAQGIEHRPPEAGAQVRILPGAPPADQRLSLSATDRVSVLAAEWNGLWYQLVPRTTPRGSRAWQCSRRLSRSRRRFRSSRAYNKVIRPAGSDSSRWSASLVRGGAPQALLCTSVQMRPDDDHGESRACGSQQPLWPSGTTRRRPPRQAARHRRPEPAGT